MIFICRFLFKSQFKQLIVHILVPNPEHEQTLREANQVVWLHLLSKPSAFVVCSIKHVAQ